MLFRPLSESPSHAMLAAAVGRGSTDSSEASDGTSDLTDPTSSLDGSADDDCAPASHRGWTRPAKGDDRYGSTYSRQR